MSLSIDTSILVAGIVSSEPHHGRCAHLLDAGPLALYSHGLAETFSTLTGGRHSFRMPAETAIELVEEDFLPCLTITVLTPTEMLRALRECDSRGVRGGAIFDFLHLVAARKVKALRFFTLNISHFRAFHREGDPEITHP